jgi:beta-galactosidase
MIRYYRNHPSVVVYETSLNEATYTDAWATQMNTAAHGEYPGNQMFTTGWQTTKFDVYCAASQGGVRSTTDSRPIIICEYGDWDLGCVYGTSITGCLDRIVRSDGEAALLRQATNHASQLSINRGLSWLCADALWSAFDYQSWSLAPFTTSGSLDIFRIPKYSAWFYKSQRSPADTLEPGPAKGGPMVFIASAWTSSSAIPVKVYSNCEQVSLYLNGTLVSTQSPSGGANLEHPPFSFAIPSFQSGTLRADGLIGGAVKATYSVGTPGTATKVSVAIDTASMQFLADGSDIALVYASVLDANNTVLPAASNSVTFSVLSGPGDLVGNNPIAAQAGIATIMLRSRTTGGAITVSATASGLTTGTATVTSMVSPTTNIIDLSGARSIARNPGFSASWTGSSLRVQLPRSAGMEPSATNLTLYNAQGKLVGLWTLVKPDNVVPVGALSRGVYFARIDNGSLVFVKE